MKLFLRACLVIAWLSVAISTQADVVATNSTLPGVIIYSLSRTNPPTRLFIAEVDLKNPRLHLRVSAGGSDPDGVGPWQTTLMPPTRIAAREKFDFVVNGDFFKARGVNDAEGTNAGFRAAQWASVSGPAMSDGKVWAVANESRPSLVVYANQRIVIENVATPPPYALQVIAGNTIVVKDGVMVPHQNKDRHPRTAVGLDALGRTLTILVVDGRKPGIAAGMSYDELGAEMLRLGCWNALNLDGGGSSVMALRQLGQNEFKILNEPTDGRERAVANVLGISIEE